MSCIRSLQARWTRPAGLRRNQGPTQSRTPSTPTHQLTYTKFHILRIMQEEGKGDERGADKADLAEVRRIHRVDVYVACLSSTNVEYGSNREDDKRMDVHRYVTRGHVVWSLSLRFGPMAKVRTRKRHNSRLGPTVKSRSWKALRSWDTTKVVSACRYQICSMCDILKLESVRISKRSFADSR